MESDWPELHDEAVAAVEEYRKSTPLTDEAAAQMVLNIEALARKQDARLREHE